MRRSGSSRASRSSERGSRLGDSNATAAYGHARASAQSASSSASRAWQVPEEPVAGTAEPARHEGGLDRAGTGQDRDLDPSREGGGDEPATGVVHPGEARVGDERVPLACLEQRQELFGAASLVVPMEADEAPGADPVPLEQDLRPPGVLAEHRVGLRAARRGHGA